MRLGGPGYFLIGEEEIQTVLKVMRSGQLSRYRFDSSVKCEPSKVYKFERQFEQFLNAEYCLGLNSCTSALLTALISLGIGPGDEVIVPGYTFIASIAAIAYSGATPIIAEIDESLTIDPSSITKLISKNTKAILAVHMLGAPCDMDKITEIAKKHELYLIEDVAQACGGSYKGVKLGSIGDCGAFSLNIFKTITAGDGGVLCTKHKAVYEKAFAFHDHGAKPFRLGVADDSSILGINLRMHELIGAIALVQLNKLESILNTLKKKKEQFKSILKAGNPNIKFRVLNDENGECSTIIVIILPTVMLANKLAKALKTKTLINSGKHYYGNMVQLKNKKIPRNYPFAFANDDLSYSTGVLPKTDDILSRSICLTIGVCDSYLGADFGINILSSEKEIEQKALEFNRIMKLHD